MFRRILVPLDGSELAELALAPAVELARCKDGQIRLLRVALTAAVVLNPTETNPVHRDDVFDVERQEAATYLSRIQARVRGGGLTVLTEVVAGPVAESIAAYACDKNIDVIVMSTHGRSGLGRWVFGSVTYEVLRRAPCPVLVVRQTQVHAAS